MIILIDYENVNESGLIGIETLSASDKMIMFYNSNSKMTIDFCRKFTNSKCSVQYVKLNKAGKNALDFQLATYLGYLIKENPKETYKIISKDKGFDQVVSFWKGRTIRISRNENIVKDSFESLSCNVKTAICEAALSFSVDYNQIASLINRYKTKQGLNNAIMKIYGSEKTGKIINAIKPLIKDKKG